jgi:hypothetical protein
MKNKEFIPRSFEEFRDWILSEIGDITITEIMDFYKKITEKKKLTKTEKK